MLSQVYLPEWKIVMLTLEPDKQAWTRPWRIKTHFNWNLFINAFNYNNLLKKLAYTIVLLDNLPSKQIRYGF